MWGHTFTHSHSLGAEMTNYIKHNWLGKKRILSILKFDLKLKIRWTGYIRVPNRRANYYTLLSNNALSNHQIYNWPQSLITSLALVLPLCEPYDSTFLTTSKPDVTLPNTQCLPSNHGHGSTVMKNWLPFVFGPDCWERMNKEMI